MKAVPHHNSMLRLWVPPRGILVSSTGGLSAGEARDSAAQAASRQQGRVLGRGMARRPSNGRTARLRRGKTGVAGAVRLQLSFLPVSPTPKSYR